MIAISSG